MEVIYLLSNVLRFAPMVDYGHRPYYLLSPRLCWSAPGWPDPQRHVYICPNKTGKFIDVLTRKGRKKLLMWPHL